MGQLCWSAGLEGGGPPSIQQWSCRWREARCWPALSGQGRSGVQRSDAIACRRRQSYALAPTILLQGAAAWLPLFWLFWTGLSSALERKQAPRPSTERWFIKKVPPLLSPRTSGCRRWSGASSTTQAKAPLDLRPTAELLGAPAYIRAWSLGLARAMPHTHCC